MDNITDIMDHFSAAAKNDMGKVVELVRTQLGEDSRSKIAAFLIAIGPQLSIEILKQLQKDEIETIILEVVQLERIDNEYRAAVLKEFYELFIANQHVLSGGLNYARILLEGSLSSQDAIDMIRLITSRIHSNKPFSFIRGVAPDHLLNFIQQEHPQIIALILSYLEPKKAAIALEKLPIEVQSEITQRMATLDRTSPEVCREIERVLEKKLSTLSPEDYTVAGGLEFVVEVLNHINSEALKQIIKTLKDEDPELGEEIEKRMCA